MKRLRVNFVIVVLFSLAFSYGVVVGRYQVFPYKQIRSIYHRLNVILSDSDDSDDSDRLYGRWHEVRQKHDMTEAQMESLSKLTTLPYLQGYHAPKEKKGVTIYDKARAYEGLNLFCSGHAPKVYLMTMDGKILHEWGIQFEEVWPNPLPFFSSEEHKEFIRKAYLYSNGDLLAIFAYIGLIKLDKDSNLLWSHLVLCLYSTDG